MGDVLALAAALAYGVSHLLGGLASLYPVIPVLAGRFVLRERIILIQKFGLGLTVIAVALIALG